MRKAIAALGVFGVAWLISRRRRSDDGMPSTGGVRERATEALPDAATKLVVGEDSSTETGDEWADRGAREPVAGGGEAPTEPGSIGPDDSAVDETMSDREMGERVESDAHEEPAPPGEMNVDDEVADEVFGDDEDASSTEGEEDVLGQGEADTEGDEDMFRQDETDMEGDEDEE